MKYTAFVVGITAVAFYLLGYQQKTRKKIILFNLTARFLFITQYVLLSAFDGAVINVTGIVATLVANNKETPFIKKHIKLFIAGINILIVSTGLIFYKNIYSILPIVAMLLHMNAFFITDEKKIRLVSLAGCPIWLTYNLICGAYGSSVGDVLSIISLLTAIYRYDIKPRRA